MSTEQISTIKFRELEAQHRNLAAHYEEVERHVRALGSGATERRAGRGESFSGPTAEQLRVLHDGLSDACFAGQPLHTEVLGADGLLLEAEVGTATDEARGQYLERLLDALDHGRQRARFAHLFGCVLDEWATAGRSEPDAEPGRADFERGLLELLSTPSSPTGPAESLNDLFDRHGSALAELRAELSRFCESDLLRPVSRGELKAYLQLLSANPQRPASLRDEARALLGNDLLVDDYAGALTVIINRDVGSWRWPGGEAAPPRLEWRWDRWRAFFDADLLTTLLLEAVGWRLAIAVRSGLLRSPALSCLDPDRRVDFRSITTTRKAACDALFLSSTPESLEELSQLGDSEGVEYEGFRFTEDSPDASQQALATIAADVRLERAAGGGPVCAVHTDVKDYFLSIPHHIVAQLLKGVGLGARWIDFIRRFVEVPLPGGEVSRRGIPLGYKLSNVIGDLLLRVLDALIYNKTRIRIVRYIDDIYFVTSDPRRAVEVWSIIERFCGDCGLALNPDKSGAVGVEVALPEGLPRGPFLWGAMELTDDGCWVPHDRSIDALTRHMQQAIERSRSTLDVVAEYNGYLNHLIRLLGPFSLLDGRREPHLEAAIRSVARVHRRCIHGGSIHGHVKRMLEERFAGVLEGARASEALLYWPITAGGLGLCNPMLVMIGFRRSRQRRPPIPPPAALPDDAGWRDNDNPWSTYYRQHLQPLAPERPEIAPELEGLRAQFLARGNARSLTAYWEWVLSTYGPQLLQGFGALSVLFPQLVPMQLVVNSQKITSSLDREMATAKSRAPSVYLPSVDFDDDIPF